MSFKLPEFKSPDFSSEIFVSAPDAKYLEAIKDGVAPDGFHATSIYPEYFKVKGKWILPETSCMDCAAILNDNDTIEVIEFRNIKKGDKVIVGRFTDFSVGIYKHTSGFENMTSLLGRGAQTSFSRDYKTLYELLKYEKENDGHILWVLGPAVIFDHDTRIALSELAKNGYINSLLAGNAMATHDLEGGLLNTALGQNIYTQESVPMGHYNHLDLINETRRAGSIESLLSEGNVKDGFVKTCIELNIPIVLAGSIRDDGPLPPVYGKVSEALDKMKEQTKKATLIITLATVLHSVSASNLTPSYKIVNGKIRPVYMYSVDISDYAINQVSAARGTVGIRTIATNVQDFVVNLKRNLLDKVH